MIPALSMAPLLRSTATAALLLALLAPQRAAGQMPHAHGTDDCREPSLACATKATPVFSRDGTLWLAWTAVGRVVVARSADLGQTFAVPTPVNAEPQELDLGPDSRPVLAAGTEGQVYVAFSLFKDKNMSGQVLFSRSTDGGRRFDPPKPLTADPESQRFARILVDEQGTLFVAWLDKRNRALARAKGEKFTGAGLMFAVSRDGGETFRESSVAFEPTCECCRIGLAWAQPGRPAVMFRNIFPGSIRDHAVSVFADLTTPGPLVRVSEDDWRTEACPHHGPSLSVAPSGTVHAAWYTAGSNRKGLFYARSENGAAFSEPLAVGTPGRVPSNPAVLALEDKVWLAWKEFDGERTSILTTRSTDGGRTWSAPATAAVTDKDTDQPLLISDGRRPYLSLLIRREGYRLIPLEAGA